ncbi:MAG: UbiD family decarboxylase [Methanothermobacter sp.]|nr:UbiD family decarboxylase [Methanothermobacter sp.]
MRKFLQAIKNEFDIIKIEREVSTHIEAAKILREHPKEIVILENIKESNIPVISGICNSREKISRALNCKKENITKRIIQAMDNPTPIENIKKLEGYHSQKANLEKLPILKYYKKDGGHYITAGAIIAKDPETMVRNASIHRMMLLDKRHLAVRIVPRHLYNYYKRAEEMGKDLPVAIVIGMHPATLLATTTSVPIDVDELEVANNFHDGKLKLFKCEKVDIEVPEAEIIIEGKILANKRTDEGPFVDLTGTYDIIRKEPIIEVERIHFKKDPLYHAILPAGLEHKLLQGLPQEPRIFKAVENTVPTVKNVILTEGGCCWLHAVVSMEKQAEGDAKNVIMAALSAHPSLKHVVVVDDDINPFDLEDVEYAIATRVKDDDIIIVRGARGSSLDPSALADGTTTKVGVDATKPLKGSEKFERII